MAVKKAEAGPLEIADIDREAVKLIVIGTAPLFFNSMSAKAQRTLLLGGRKKTASEKRTEMKHHPVTEWRDSLYMSGDLPTDEGGTLIGFPGGALKSALCEAALETPGVTKTSIGRLVSVPGEFIRVWGTPVLRCDVVRSADAAKTPDVRTRAVLRDWIAEFTIVYAKSALTRRALGSLVNNAGAVIGIGDYRQGKGRGSFGTFRIAMDDDQPLVDALKANAGFAAQTEALKRPIYWGPDTSWLIGCYKGELAERGLTPDWEDGEDVPLAAE